MYRKLAIALYSFSLIVILLELARGSPVIGASVLVLAGTMGDVRVSQKGESKVSTRPNLLCRTLRRVGGQIVVLAFVLLDIGGLGFALVAPVWLGPWVTINLTALVLGTLSWTEDRRIQRESATATQRLAEKVLAERQDLEKREREAQRQHQAEQAERLRQVEHQLREAEERLRQEEEKRGVQTQQQAEQAEHLRQMEHQLREAQERLRREDESREAQRKQQAEQAERLCQMEQQLKEAEERWRRGEEEREAQRQQQAEQRERIRQAEKRRQAERRRRREECEAQRKHQGERKQAAQFQADWWSVLGVAPSASRDEIMQNFRRRIKQCHPDRVAGLAPEFLELAEEHTKALNEAYENAMRCRQGPALC